MRSLVARGIARHARLVLLRLASEATPPVFTDVEISAHVIGYQPGALVEGSGLQQGDRQMRIAQAALDAAGAPRPPRAADRVVVDGVTCAVLHAEPRLAQGRVALHLCHIRGA